MAAPSIAFEVGKAIGRYAAGRVGRYAVKRGREWITDPSGRAYKRARIAKANKPALHHMYKARNGGPSRRPVRRGKRKRDGNGPPSKRRRTRGPHRRTWTYRKRYRNDRWNYY